MVLEVCWDLVDLLDHLEALVLLELTGLKVSKETWDHKVNQAHPVSKEFQEHRVFLVLKAPLDHLVKKDLRADRGCLDCLELMVLLVILEKRVHLERKDRRVLLVLRDLLVIPALVVLREPMVSEVLRVQRERREKMVSQVLRETWESRETGVSLGWLAHVEKMVPRVLKVELDPMESQVLLVLLERRVNWASQGCQVIQEDKDLRAPVGSQASQELTERKEPGALLENLVQEAKEVQRVHGEPEEPGVPQENQDLREQQATTALQVHPERGDLKDLRDQWVFPDQKDPLDHQEKMGCPDTLDSVEKQVSKEKRVHLVQEVLSGPRDPLERPVLLVKEVILDPRDHQESRDFQVLEAKREPRETPALRDPPVKTAPLVFEGSPEREVFLVPQVRLV